jgi:hypothetical protein
MAADKEREREYRVLDVVFEVLDNYRNHTGSPELIIRVLGIMDDSTHIQDTLKKLFYILQEMIMEDFDDLPVDDLKDYQKPIPSQKDMYHAYEIREVKLFLQYLDLNYKIQPLVDEFYKVFQLVFNWEVEKSKLYFSEKSTPTLKNMLPNVLKIKNLQNSPIIAVGAAGGNKKTRYKTKM